MGAVGETHEEGVDFLFREYGPNICRGYKQEKLLYVRHFINRILCFLRFFKARNVAFLFAITVICCIIQLWKISMKEM